MMNEITQEKVNLILAMEEQLSDILKDEPHKLWEENFIRKQIDRRNAGGKFTLTDHIRAMVYSMLSSGNQWANVAKNVDSATGCIPAVDEIFYDYDVEKLKQSSAEQLRENIKKIHCGTPSTFNQMKALLSTNIDVLCSLEEKYGAVDTYYQKFIEIDDSLKTLVTVLSANVSVIKLEQMKVALVCEYLRNVGYDIPKPDRHIRRILGSDYLALSDEPIVPEFEAFDIVVALADRMKKPVAEVDYILWSYCAKGYGGICKKTDFPCQSEECVAGEYCRRKNGGNK